MFLKMNKKLVLLTVLIILSVAAVLIYLNWDRVYSAPTTATSTVPSTTPSVPSPPPSPVIPVTPIAPKSDVTKYIIIFFAVFISLGMGFFFLMVGIKIRDRMNKQKETKNEDPREKYKKEIEELFRMHGDDDAFVLNELSKKKNHEFTEAYLDKKRKIKNQFINQIEWILFNTEMSTESKRQHLLELKKDGVYKHFGYDIDLYYNRLGKKLIDRLRSQVSTRDYVSDMTDLKVLMNNAKTKEEKEKILYDYFEHLPNRGQVSLMNAFETGE